MGGRFTEIPQETFEQIVVDAGVLLRKFDLFDPDYDITPDIITATTGGVTLSAEPEIYDMGEDVDNCPNNTKELARLSSWRCTIGSTAVGSSPETMQMILGAADLSGDIDVIPRAVLELSDFKDLWWVGDRVDGGLLAVHIANALSISGLSLQTSKAAKGQFDFEIQAHVSIYEQDKVPMTFYVMGPGAGTITGLSLTDFTIQPGVPTQIPVRYVMGDGSLEEPTDYSKFTFTATLPAGGSITPDGKITLANRGDEVAVTVTLERPGGESFTATAEASVEALRVVRIYVNGGSITVQEGTTEQIVTEIEMSDGSIITPTDFETNFTYTADSLPDGTSISADGVITGGGVPGTFNVTVSYTSGGETFTDTATVTINAELKPLDYTSIYLITVPAGQTIQGQINRGTKSYTVDWGDGERVTANYSSGQYITHTYENAGDYTIMVKDNDAIPTAIGSLVHFSPRDIVNEVLIDTNNDGISWQRYANMEIFAYGQHLLRASYSNIVDNPALKTVSFMNPESINFYLSAVKNCAALEEVHVMASSMSISRNVSANGWFDGCPNLKVFDLSHLTSVPTLSVNPWTGFTTTAEVRVPAALLNDFKTATNWSIRANQFVGV